MTDPRSWDVISGASRDDSGPVVLGADFPGRRRGEAGFPDLASKIGTGYRFLQTRPPAVRCQPRPADAAYVGPWLEGIKATRPHVLAVLGHRVGSVYAAAIAEGIAQWQPMPKIILFDPQLSSAELLCLEFQREISSISSLLGDDEIERDRNRVAEVALAAGPDVAGAAAEMVGSYLETVTPAFERAGLGDARDEKFTRSFESYISWLCAAGLIDPSSAWERSTGIASSAYAALPARPRPAGDGPGLVGRVIPVDVGHADLLRSEAVARAVLDLLESR
jgi:hypothetical protein